MARDYANRTQPPPRKHAPGWVWMVSGIALGLFIAFLFYLATLPPSSEGKKEIRELVKRPAERTRSEPASDPEKNAKEEKKDNKFDFYTILPEYEVAIPDEELAPEKTEPQELTQGSYVIQVGSFRSDKDADTRKAQLALLGLVAKIHTVTMEGDDTWHRVRVGPFDDREQLDEVRHLLQDNEIEHMVLREKQ